MTDRDPSKASRATLERLAYALHQWDDFTGFLRSPGIAGPRAQAMREALAAWRSETAPLRTRAEVDAHIVSVVRGWHANAGGRPVGMADGTTRSLEQLCAEPTAESEPPPVPAPDACSCDEALALRERLRRIRLALCALQRGEISNAAAAAAIEHEARDA